ncbi:hypothetical protein K474DRAFT_1762656 [Panus rudis PR-1116 ss-1]|nr:hypothetical protein K474DRAFT_1762656 [Panus rudis PR-1116 ss-1]
MSAPNGGDAKPKGILKNSSSATTLVDGTHHREQGAGSHTAASTPSIAEYEQQTPNTISSVSSTDSIPPLPSIPYGNRSQHQHRPGVQPSPFSASFDPNVSSYTLTSPIVSSSGSSALTPSIPPRSVNHASAAAVSATTHSRSSSVSSRDVQEQWTQIMASSLQTLATQFTAASQALAASTHITDGSIIEEQDEEGQRPSTSRGPAPAIDSLALSTQTLRSGQEQLMILQRLEAIEKTQAHLMNQMTVLESAHAQAQSTVSSTPATVVEESQQSQNTGVGEIEEVRIDGNKNVEAGRWGAP